MLRSSRRFLFPLATFAAASFSQPLSAAMHSSAPTHYRHHVMQPEGRAFLSCRVLLHENFEVADVPAETIDFEDPTKSLPLVVAVSPMGPMVFAVATRPAYGDGATSQWLEFLLRQDNFEIGAITRTQVGIHPAVTCDALQTNDGMTMRSRMVMLEDGGRMLTMSAMAPDELWAAVEARFTTMINSFEFQQPQGATAALFPGEAPPVAVPATSSSAPSAAPVARETPPPAPAAAGGPSDTLPSARLTAAEFAALVLADDATTLDQSAGINANLRDRGVGLVPRVLSIDPDEKSARLGAGAIEAVLRLPFGWYALDDGRRTLVFDGDNRIQINLSLRPRTQASLVAIANELTAPYLEREPGLEVALLNFADGIVGAGVQGADVDGEKLDQVFFLRDVGREDHVLVARVTASADDTTRALDLAGHLLATLETVGDLVATQ